MGRFQLGLQCPVIKEMGKSKKKSCCQLSAVANPFPQHVIKYNIATSSSSQDKEHESIHNIKYNIATSSSRLDMEQEGIHKMAPIHLILSHNL